MTERPIIFSAAMVRALLDGTKTQTRRIVKPQFGNAAIVESRGGDGRWTAYGDAPTNYNGEVQMNDWRVDFRCPYGVPSDRLWVRETWADTNGEEGPMISYRAGGDRFLVDESYPVDYSLYPGCMFSMWCGDLRRGVEGHAWRSPIHMPRWASRITLEITDVRVQRLQEISTDDFWAEGIDSEGDAYNEGERYASAGSPVSPERYAFVTLWEEINGLRPGCAWSDNPWVWALTFKVDHRVSPKVVYFDA